jgi:hypothetical protein
MEVKCTEIRTFLRTEDAACLTESRQRPNYKITGNTHRKWLRLFQVGNRITEVSGKETVLGLFDGTPAVTKMDVTKHEIKITLTNLQG